MKSPLKLARATVRSLLADACRVLRVSAAPAPGINTKRTDDYRVCYSADSCDRQVCPG